MKKMVIIIFIGIHFSLFYSCNRKSENIIVNASNNQGIISNQPINPVTKSKLNGIWKRVNDSGVFYMLYDSTTLMMSFKFSDDYNFRDERIGRIKVDSNRLWSVYNDGRLQHKYWVTLSQTNDSIILCYDSLYRYPMTFIRDSNNINFSKWIKDIYALKITQYPQIKPFYSEIQALSYYDSTWYVLTGTGRDDGNIHIVKNNSTQDSIISMPTARAMEVIDGYLWLAGNFYIEKRNLTDTALIIRKEIDPFLTENGPNNWVEGIGVNDSIVMVIGSFGQYLFFDLNCNFLREQTGNMDVEDIVFNNGRLWGSTGSGSRIFEIDPLTLNAIHSYYLYSDLGSGTYQGIATKNGLVICAEYIYEYMRLIDVELP